MKQIKWNEGWQFWPDGDAFALVWSVPESARSVTLPHDAMIETPADPMSPNKGNTGYRSGGNYTYRKLLRLEKAELARRHVLKLEGVYCRAMVYVNEQLADRLKGYYAEGCELVVSDIPGFGVGALDHVYHGLAEKFPGQFDLGPFTVLVEPKTVDLLREGEGGDLDYLLNTQLVEADLIVLNKIDLLAANQIEADLAWLRDHYPDAEVISISARTGEGLEALSHSLMTCSASMRRPDIGYGGPVFMEAMTRLSEYYLQYHATVCCNDFDGNTYLTDLARAVHPQPVLQSGYL